jgi:hypothetical protein
MAQNMGSCERDLMTGEKCESPANHEISIYKLCDEHAAHELEGWIRSIRAGHVTVMFSGSAINRR